MNRKKEPLPWYAGPFVGILAIGGALGIVIYFRDESEPSKIFVFVPIYMAIVYFSVRGIYAKWKHTDNKFLIILAKIAKAIMITILVVFNVGVIWFLIAKPDIGHILGPALRDVVTAIMPKK